jgi:phospholipid/cholesterol/gamma-HCH transport system substrate-binding protein
VTTFSTKLKVGAFLLVTLLGIVYVAVRYVDIGDHLGNRRYEVWADFDTGGGIFTNASVTYRGFPVGEVGGVALHGSGVRVRMLINAGTRIASGVRAVITPRSAVGEQYVDLRPEAETGTFLRPGDLIPRERTSGPLPIETLLVNLDDLVTSIDADDVAVVLDEFGKAFEGNELALKKLFDATSLLINDAMRYREQTRTLIRDGRTALAAEAAGSSAIREWAQGLAQLAATVRQADPDLRRLFTTGPPAADQLAGLLRDLDPSVGTLLGNLISVNEIAVARIAGIEHMLVLYPVAIEVGFTIMGADGTAHLGWVPQDDPPPTCPGSPPACPPGSGIRDAAKVQTPSTLRPQVDPATGRVLTADGRLLLFGDSGGQSQLAGAQSWKALLISGVTS